LFDMLGNALEYVLGQYRTDIEGTPETDPEEVQTAQVLLRGGGAYLWPTASRAASIKFMGEEFAFHAHGLRLARSLRPDEVGMRWNAPRFAPAPDAGLDGSADASTADSGAE
jgi:hypothetical protein